MNCCDDKENDGEKPEYREDTSKHSNHNSRHIIMMVLCCGLPLLLLALVPVVMNADPVLGSFLGTYAPLLCPILMIPMLVMMFRGKRGRS